MRSSAVFLLLWGLLVCEGSSAAAPKQDPPAGTLHSIAVEGNHRYSSAAITAVAGLQPGQPITAAQLESARQKLQDFGVFSSVQVVEIEQVFPMRFERLQVNPVDVRDYLKTTVPLYSDEIPGTEAVLARYREAVQQYVQRTHASLKVKAAASDENPQQFAVVFAPDAPTVTISQVKVSGNEAVDTGTLLRAINSVAIGAPLTDVRLKQICEGAIRTVYAQHGYVAVTCPNIQTEPSKTDLGMIVSLQIKEGPVFKFGPIRFRGSGLDPDEVRSAIPFKPGQTFNGAQVDDFRIDLQHRLRQRGFLDASVTYENKPDDANRTVNITYNVVPGSIYNFAKLEIKGLDITSEPVVEKMWGEKPGKPFNPEYPDFFLKRVEEQQLFDHLSDTSSDYSADASTHNVVVRLYFKGGESPADKEKKKKEAEEKRKTDGTWSPY